MENIEEKKFLTRELAIKTLAEWAKENGKNPPQDELEECIDVHWEKDGQWVMSNMDSIKDNPPPGAYFAITNFLEDIED